VADVHVCVRWGEQEKNGTHFNQNLIQLSNYPTIQLKIQLPQNKNVKNSSSKTQILAG
jgi:tRNA(Ile)-lysidine synthase TilS/MesJ